MQNGAVVPVAPYTNPQSVVQGMVAEWCHEGFTSIGSIAAASGQGLAPPQAVGLTQQHGGVIVVTAGGQGIGLAAQPAELVQVNELGIDIEHVAARAAHQLDAVARALPEARPEPGDHLVARSAERVDEAVHGSCSLLPRWRPRILAHRPRRALLQRVVVAGDDMDFPPVPATTLMSHK